MYSLSVLETLTQADRLFTELITGLIGILMTLIYFAFCKNKHLLNLFIIGYGVAFYNQTGRLEVFLCLIPAGLLKSVLFYFKFEKVGRNFVTYSIVVTSFGVLTAYLGKSAVYESMANIMEFLSKYNLNIFKLFEKYFFSLPFETGIIASFLKELKNLN